MKTEDTNCTMFSLVVYDESMILNNTMFFQVPLLLSIGEEDTALVKATESGDTDLVYLVLFHIWQKVFGDITNLISLKKFNGIIYVISSLFTSEF